MIPDVSQNLAGEPLPDAKTGPGPIAALDYDSIVEGSNKLIARLFSSLMHTRGDAFWHNEALNIGMVHILVGAAIGAKADSEALTPAAQDLYHMRTHETTVLNLMLLHRLRTGRLPPDASRVMGLKLQEAISGRANNPFQRHVQLYRGVIEALAQFFSGREPEAVRALLQVYDAAEAVQRGGADAPQLPVDDRKLAEIAYRVILGFIERDAGFGETADDHDLQAASDAITVLTAAALAGSTRATEPTVSIDTLLQVVHTVATSYLQTSHVQRMQAIAQKLAGMNPAEQTLMLRTLATESGQVLALSRLLERALTGADLIAPITDLVQAIATAYWRREGAARRHRH